ncbi:hypothetical protein LG329_16200 [Virgibacillus necropolis]|uniref:hypothetical protein n=1 Tax=Virgibacillus necropolis TaxID=163877 RepID=UPI0038518187
MEKENVIEFLFNGKRFRGMKNVLLILFWVIAIFLDNLLPESESSLIFKVLFVPVMSVLFILSLVKIKWYDKKKNIKTGVKEWITSFIMVCLIIACFYV